MFFFFFFQAEDGIRDTSVTGVQTCALPICSPRLKSAGMYIYSWGRRASERATPQAKKWCVNQDNGTKEIGRASCRERVEITVVAGAMKKKKESMKNDAEA